MRIAILGSTGSIGEQTLNAARAHPDRIRVTALAAGSSGERLKAQAAEFSVRHLALFDEAAASHLGVPGGMSALVDLATHADVDLVVVSVSGAAALFPTEAAIRAGKAIALASKEVLVAAGEHIMPLIREHGTRLTPIDSEHSAIFQCLQGYRADQVDSLILTASGGPFRGWTRSQLAAVTPQMALKHPTWTMGGKITIDSASLFNKALEMIEAKWLFDIPMDHIEVVVHPTSIVHSLVRFRDGSVLGQMGWPNMELPIQYALLWPDRVPNSLPRWDPISTSPLVFEEPDEEAFPALQLARQAEAAGGTMPAAFSAANEQAVALFLSEKIGFLDIPRLAAETMEAHQPSSATLEAIAEADLWARETVCRLAAFLN